MRGHCRPSCAIRRLPLRSLSTDASSPSTLRHDAQWSRCVTPALADQLLHDGYCVVPNAFPPRYLRQLRDEMHLLRAKGLLYPNSTHILVQQPEQRTLLLEKHHILETELALEDVRDQVPTLRDFFEERVVLAPLVQTLPQWLGLETHMVKLQYNEGHGACFPMHFDTYGDDGKCVTAVLYLNEQWADGDGGEIVLYPFPRPRVEVAPTFGQLVLFSSQHMLHRVLPSSAPRYALTTWMYHRPPPTAKASSASYYRGLNSTSQTNSSPFEDVMSKVLRSSFRRHLVKLLYRDEWARSLHESHKATPAFRQYMATQSDEMATIRAATEQMLANFRAKAASNDADALPATVEELETRLGSAEHREFATRFHLPWF